MAKVACLISTTGPVLFAIILYNISFVYWDPAHMGNWFFHVPPGVICWALTTPELRALAFSFQGFKAAMGWWLLWQVAYVVVVYGLMASFFDRDREARLNPVSESPMLAR